MPVRTFIVQEMVSVMGHRVMGRCWLPAAGCSLLVRTGGRLRHNTLRHRTKKPYTRSQNFEIQTPPSQLPRSKLPLLCPREQCHTQGPFPKATQYTLPQSRRMFSECLLQEQTKYPKGSRKCPCTKTTFNPTPTNMPTTAAIPRHPYVQPPQPRSQFKQ